MAQDFELTMPTERAEKYLAKMAKAYDGTLPEPISNIDKYLKILAENGSGGGSGGGITPKKLENADLNTVTETGSYYADFDHTCKNVPTKVGSYGFSIIVTNGGGVVYQLLMKNTIAEENRLFMRVIDSDGEVYPWSNYMQESDVTVDSTLSETSTRPPQNAIVTKRLNEIESNSAKKTDLAAYLPKDGTAKKAEMLSSGQLRSAFCYNADSNFSNGYIWFKIGTATLSGSYNTISTTFLAVCGWGKHALYTLRVRLKSTGNAVESMSFFESCRTGSMPTGFFRAVAINGEKNVTFELWAKVASQYEGTRVVILNEMNLGGANNGIFWELTSKNSADAQQAPTSGDMYTDSTDSSICAVATKAETLTDSGWDSSLELFSEVAASTLKCRLYGKLVEIRGSFTLNEPSQHTPFAKIPLKFRPSEDVFTTIQVGIASISNLNFPLEFIICSTGELVVDSGTGANLPANREVKVCVQYLID